MFSVPRLISERSRLSGEEFLQLLETFCQMSEKERERFASDPQNAPVLEHYNLYLDRIALRVMLPLAALVLVSIVAGALLVG